MKFIKVPNDIDEKLIDAIAYFWTTRSGQIERQQNHGVIDNGNRGAVTGGKQLDGFVDLISDLLKLNGVPSKCIFTKSDLEIPGFYRPNKKWDLLVVDNMKLLVAIEFKSQVGPSFGNNFNNRTEEAMGSALDLWTAYREGIFGQTVAPWLGYFLLLEDCEKSNEPVRVRSSHFPVLKEFNNVSYKKRYEIFCNKLLLERQYNAACFLTTSYSETGVNYNFPHEALSFETFMLSMLGAVVPNFSPRGKNHD